MSEKLTEPTLEQVLEFCARDPVERVFLEDVARRGFGRFVGVQPTTASLAALCHLGANLVPSGDGLRARSRDVAAASASKMIIGNEQRGRTSSGRRPAPRCRAARRPARPARLRDHRRRRARRARACAPATLDDLERLLPICAAAHEFELGVDPLERDAEGFRWRTRAQIDDGRSWLWVEDDVILLQGRGVGVDAGCRPDPAGLGRPGGPRRRGYGARGLRDLCRLLLADDAGRDAVRPHRERARDRALRVDRHAARRPLPLAPLLSAHARSSPGTARACSASRGVAERRPAGSRGR